MSTMTNREAVKHIRQAVKAAGYDYWFTYNDKHNDYRRIKCMRNGYYFSPAQYAKWEKAIAADLKQRGVEVIEMGFKEGMAERGSYIGFVAKIKLEA